VRVATWLPGWSKLAVPTACSGGGLPGIHLSPGTEIVVELSSQNIACRPPHRQCALAGSYPFTPHPQRSTRGVPGDFNESQSRYFSPFFGPARLCEHERGRGTKEIPWCVETDEWRVA